MATNDSWQDYVAACDVMCCVVGTDGNICAANESLASRAGCSIAELRAAPLTALLAPGQTLPPQFEELLRAGVQGVASSIPLLYMPWRTGALERVEVRVSPLYDSTTGSMRQILVTVMHVDSVDTTGPAAPVESGSAEASADDSMEDVPPSATPASTTVEGLRNVSGVAQQLLQLSSVQLSAADAPRQTATAWSVLFASVLQKSMFSNVLLARPTPPAAEGAAGSSSSGYEIWHASRGLQELLGVPASSLLGKTATELCASADAPAPLSEQSQELHHAIATRTNCLIETVLTTSSGAPLFCLAYVLPLHCQGARQGTTAVAFLDVHRSLPYMQRQMEAREIGDCDLYTFVKFSLLNCLVTDPSCPTPNPAYRNAIIFASHGFSAMCGATADEVLGRNCRFLQSPEFLSVEPPPPTAEAREAVAHMAAALDARQESLTFLRNFRKDGTKFDNLLFMTPISYEGSADGGGGGGVLFWVGVQHPIDDDPAVAAAAAGALGTHAATTPASVADADLTRLLRACHESLQALQLQELYSAYTSQVHRTAIVIHGSSPKPPMVQQQGSGGAGGGSQLENVPECAVCSSDGTSAPEAAAASTTCVCRLCENLVLAEALPSHTQFCKIVSQCKTIVACADGTLSRVLCKLNAASNGSLMTGQSGSQAGQVVELFRSFTSTLLGVTAASPVLPQLSSLTPRLDELTAAAVPRATAACWADIKAAGQRKLAALQHAALWTSELQATIVSRPGADPLAHGQAPCLADFEVVRELQRGSHAAVFMVRKVQTGDVFAMKVIDRQRGRSHRLATERKVLFSCSSPFVVTTFFAFEDPARLYLVMECLHSDCKQLLQDRGVIGEQQAVSLAADVVLALEHLHAVGICHRDLKPENLLLTSEGRAKLADFGLSHVAAKATSDEELARDPSIVGTPFYMAPEAIQGRARGLEAACDWWSFGVILYEFLTGFPPFQGAKVAEIYRAILTLSCIAPIQKCNVSPEAADLVLRLLVLQPRQRLVGAPRVMAHPFFRTIDWPQHAHSGGGARQPAAAAGAAPSALPTLHSLAGQSLTSCLSRPMHGGAASAVQAAAAGHAAPMGACACAATCCCASAVAAGVPRANSANSANGSSRSDGERMSASALSAASTHDAGAALQLHLQPEASDAHIDNLTGLNDRVAGAAAGAKAARTTPPPPAAAAAAKPSFATNW